MWYLPFFRQYSSAIRVRRQEEFKFWLSVEFYLYSICYNRLFWFFLIPECCVCLCPIGVNCSWRTSLFFPISLLPIHIKLYLFLWAFVYIYIQTECFVVSQLFRVARHGGRLKLRSKRAQLCVRLSITPLSQQVNHVGLEIIRHYVAAFVLLTFLPCRIALHYASGNREFLR